MTLLARLPLLLDTALDRAVVPGYSRIGIAVRRRWWDEDLTPDALAGRTVAVTGANSGLGKATALGALELGARVRLLCRSRERGVRAQVELQGRIPGADVTVDECDLSDLGSVTAAASRLRDELPSLAGLVHNAGVLPPERSESAQGHELTVATHVLGPHLLTAELAPLLRADRDARVVFLSSGGMYTQPLRVDDPEYQLGDYRGAVAYARTKRMQVVLAQLWGEHLPGVAVHAMHPGWAATPGITDSLPGFSRVIGPILRDADQGADTAVWLLAASWPGATTGLFWHDRRPRPTSYLPTTRHTPAQAQQLWDYCAVSTRR